MSKTKTPKAEKAEKTPKVPKTAKADRVKRTWKERQLRTLDVTAKCLEKLQRTLKSVVDDSAQDDLSNARDCISGLHALVVNLPDDYKAKVTPKAKFATEDMVTIVADKHAKYSIFEIDASGTFEVLSVGEFARGMAMLRPESGSIFPASVKDLVKCS